MQTLPLLWFVEQSLKLNQTQVLIYSILGNSSPSLIALIGINLKDDKLTARSGSERKSAQDMYLKATVDMQKAQCNIKLKVRMYLVTDNVGIQKVIEA